MKFKLDNGKVLLLVAEFEKSRPYIHMQTFSPDSRHLAVMD